MPMDGVTIGLAARELNGALAGGRVDKVTQPERDELIITIRADNKNHALLLSASADCARAQLTNTKKTNPMEPPNLCMLLRKHIAGGRVKHVRQAESDRILEVCFEHVTELGDRAQKTLICEFMGKHSNLILVDANGRIMESARRVNDTMSSVREVLPGYNYMRPPAHGKLPFDAFSEEELARALSQRAGALYKALFASVSGLSSALARELAYRAAGDEEAYFDISQIPAISKSVRAALDSMLEHPSPRILLNDSGEAIDLMAFEYLSRAHIKYRAYDTLSDAMEDYYKLRDLRERMSQKSAALHRLLKTNIERCEKKRALQLDALTSSERMEEYRIKGELISASPHLIAKGAKIAQLPNYYDENLVPLNIELDEKLNAAQNAQRYFKLYRKAQSARKLAQEQSEKTAEELLYLEGQTENLRKCETESELSEIREELAKLGYAKQLSNRKQLKSLPPSAPLKFEANDGTVILVGKNNLQNEKLTFGAQPDEWWLHAKDMPGSHVIVLNPAASDETLIFAAKLAAKYSKGAASSNVPVDMTRRKYVKKPGGAKPGFVIYTHQKTLYVTPG